MKTSILVLSAFAVLSMTSIPSYAKDEMAMPMPTTQASTQKTIAGKGTIVLENKANAKVTLQHEAIPAIGWGAMTMEFKVKDKMLLDKVKQGDKVQFTLVLQGQDYVITSIK